MLGVGHVSLRHIAHIQMWCPSIAGELDEATDAEAAAVEAEDFEKAAASSAQADAAKARLADLQQTVRAADSTCEHLV